MQRKSQAHPNSSFPPPTFIDFSVSFQRCSIYILFQLYSVYILFNNNTNIEEDKKRNDLKIVFVCVSLILTSSGIKDRARQRSHFKEKLKIGSRDFTV